MAKIIAKYLFALRDMPRKDMPFSVTVPRNSVFIKIIIAEGEWVMAYYEQSDDIDSSRELQIEAFIVLEEGSKVPSGASCVFLDSIEWAGSDFFETKRSDVLIIYKIL